VHQAVCWDLVADVINIPHLWCNGQMSCGGGAVGITGTGIANMIAKFTAPHVIGDSTGFDDGTNYTQWPEGVSTENSGLGQTLPNSASPGTVQNETICVNSSGQARVCNSADTTGEVAGIAVQGAGTAGIVRYCITQCPGIYDNQTVINDVAIVSSTTGLLHDTGTALGVFGVDNFIVDGVNTGTGTIAQTDLLTPRRVSVAINAASNPNLHIQTGLGDGVNVIASATYPVLFGGNKTTLTWQIKSISCYTDNAGTSALNVTNNAGTALTSGTCTCNNTKTSMGQACTQSATTTLAPGDAFNFAFTSDGASKGTTWAVEITQ
jgi:hypothetical protein